MIRCECGYEAAGHTEHEQVEDARAHARDVHGMEISEEQILASQRGTR
jgi:predicted small metal-binding protein